MTRELLQQALDALADCTDEPVRPRAYRTAQNAITALREALAAPMPEPVAWLCENAAGHRYFRWKKPMSEYKPVPLYAAPPAAPAPVVPADQWKAAIDDELVCCHIGTTDSFPDAKAALKNLIDWHVSVALDPAVSSDAQALIDKGKSAAPVVREPLTSDQFADMVADASMAVDLAASPLKLLDFARAVLKAYGITGGGND